MLALLQWLCVKNGKRDLRQKLRQHIHTSTQAIAAWSGLHCPNCLLHPTVLDSVTWINLSEKWLRILFKAYREFTSKLSPRQISFSCYVGVMELCTVCALCHVWLWAWLWSLLCMHVSAITCSPSTFQHPQGLLAHQEIWWWSVFLISAKRQGSVSAPNPPFRVVSATYMS